MPQNPLCYFRAHPWLRSRWVDNLVTDPSTPGMSLGANRGGDETWLMAISLSKSKTLRHVTPFWQQAFLLSRVSGAMLTIYGVLHTAVVYTLPSYIQTKALATTEVRGERKVSPHNPPYTPYIQLEADPSPGRWLIILIMFFHGYPYFFQRTENLFVFSKRKEIRLLADS